MPTPVRSIAFVTGNAGKYATAREHLRVAGIEVQQVPLDLREIQSTQVREVAKHKAEQAFQSLRSPLIVQDSGFGLDELGGWPGPMVRQLVEAVGARGVVHIADLTSNRRCGFVSTLVYVDAGGTPHEFQDAGNRGTIAAIPRTEPLVRAGNEAWSPLWQVFVPDGASGPLAGLGEDERRPILRSWRAGSAFTRLAQWLTDRDQSSEEASGISVHPGR